MLVAVQRLDAGSSPMLSGLIVVALLIWAYRRLSELREPDRAAGLVLARIQFA
jgi:heme A synthase